MKIGIGLLAALLLIGCREKKSVSTAIKHPNIDSNANYVKEFFSKNNWNYPVHIDSCDTCLEVKYYVEYIVKNKYVIAAEAFDILANSQLEIDSNVAYRLNRAIIYKDSNEIRYSIAIEKNKSNLERDCCVEGWGTLDSNRILVSGNRAIFSYKKRKLTFLGWIDW